jgi:RNA polymerase sigma-70 factor (ECF subfamily)
MSEDTILIEQAQAGQSVAFTALYQRYVDKIYKFVFYKTMHKETAEDLTSKVFFKVLKKINTYKEGSASFQTWLYTVARNTVIDHYRSQKKDYNIDDIWDLSNKEDIAENVEVNIQIEKVKEYLKDLKTDQREIIMLRLWQGLSYKEIAEVIGKNEANCKVIYSRTVKKMRENLIIVFILGLLINNI